MRPRSIAALLALTVAFGATTALAAGGGGGNGGVGLPPSLKIKPLLVPVVNNGRIERYNHLEVTLELANAAKLPEAQGIVPRLQDAVLAAIYTGVDQGWIVRGNIANAQALRQKVDESTEKLIGKEEVTRVLITPIARQASWP